MNKISVRYIEITSEDAGRRLDNFLVSVLKNIPKSMIYRIIRKGEVRVNKKRAKPEYKLVSGDVVRIPPVYFDENTPIMPSEKLSKILEKAIIFEDNHLIVINKPAGVAVHGGSKVSLGVIEALRAIRPNEKFLELAHRLDRDTSGCLLIAKKRSILRQLHDLFRQGKVNKIYQTLTLGHWKNKKNLVKASLRKNQLESGERIVKAVADGKESLSEFNVVETFTNYQLMEVVLHTGRTHQIRVHAQISGHPIAGDEKYGDKAFNKLMRQKGLTRLFLHAMKLQFTLPTSDKQYSFTAKIDGNLQKVLKNAKTK